MIPVVLSLGSNIEPRRHYLRQALHGLPAIGVRVRRVSKFQVTAPVEGVAGGDFLNAMVEAETRLAPGELLARLHQLEHRAGRPLPPRPSGQSRTLDLDIVFYGRLHLCAPGLCLPHPAWRRRAFIRAGLKELWPAGMIPGIGNWKKDI